MLENSVILKPNMLISDIESVKSIDLPKFVTYFFRFYQILFMVDLGFFECKSIKTKLFLRFVAISLSFAICVFCMYSMFNLIINFTTILSAAFMIHYFISICFINLMTKDMTFRNFLNTLLNIDTKLDFRYFNHDCMKIIVFIILSLITTISSIFVYCGIYSENCSSSWIIMLIYMIPMVTLDTISIIYFFIFYSVYRRLIKLTTILNKSFTDIVSCHILYKFIIENTLKVKSRFDIVVSRLIPSISIVNIFNYYN